MTRTHTLAVAILGLWIGWTLFMWFLAGRSFSTVDGVLNKQDKQFAAATQSMTPDNTRLALRYLASEINRKIFSAYGYGGIVLGIFLVFLVAKQAPRDKFSVTLAAGMLVIVLLLSLVVTPQIISIGRSIDFVPRNPPPPGFRRFWMLHGAFTLLDGTKLLAGLVLMGRWIFKA